MENLCETELQPLAFLQGVNSHNRGWWCKEGRQISSKNERMEINFDGLAFFFLALYSSKQRQKTVGRKVQFCAVFSWWKVSTDNI